MDLASLPSAVSEDVWHWQFAERFEILRLLAQGGQGTIYAAKDCRSGLHVALKLIDSHDVERPQAHECLMLEAGIGNCLTSEHVVTVFDAGRDAATGLSYLTMELLTGTDLQQQVEHHGPIAPTTVVEYLRQVAVGLDEAHNWRDSKHRLTPIVHRDLKPANLFLSKREDDTPLIKILDFGIAKIIERSTSVSFGIRGSPLYMAPEQVSGEHVSPATDIWALGLLTFFLLTGKAYWLLGQERRCALPALLGEVARGATVLPSVRAKQLDVSFVLPDAFDKWFLRCVHPDPKQRFGSAGACVHALGRALNVAPTGMPSSAARPKKCRGFPGRRVALEGREAASIPLRLLSSIAPNTSGWVVHLWQSLWFVVGMVGGFLFVVGSTMWVQQHANPEILRGLGRAVVRAEPRLAFAPIRPVASKLDSELRGLERVATQNWTIGEGNVRCRARKLERDDAADRLIWVEELRWQQGATISETRRVGELLIVQ